MLERIKYLGKKHIVKDDFSNNYLTILEIASNMRTACLKYNINKKLNAIDSIETKLYELLEYEGKILDNMLNEWQR
jgi:hypothetical protein